MKPVVVGVSEACYVGVGEACYVGVGEACYVGVSEVLSYQSLFQSRGHPD